MFRWKILGLLAAIAVGGSSAALAAEGPAVARPSFPIDGQLSTQGVVFFVAANTRSGAAAVGTAHTFDLAKLVRAEGGQFVLYSMGSAGTRVNERNVGNPQMLREGDQIQVGGTTFTFTKNPLPGGVRLVDLEDYQDDSFSRRSTQLYAKTVTGDMPKLKSGPKVSPLVLGVGAILVVMLVLIVVLT